MEEKQKLGFRGQLDINGNTLSLLHIKSILGVSDDFIRNVLHFEQGGSLPHVGILLLDGFFERLSEICRKPRCFANSLRGLVDIGCSAHEVSRLERNTLWLSIDQDIAARTPVDFLLARASSYVVFPAPDAPIKAVNCPGLTNP